MSKWVSVKDMMPGDLPDYCPYEWVMVWSEDNREFGIARYIDNYGWELLGESALDIPRPRSGQCYEELMMPTLPATHWQLIPVPRKKLYEKKEVDEGKTYPF